VPGDFLSQCKSNKIFSIDSPFAGGVTLRFKKERSKIRYVRALVYVLYLNLSVAVPLGCLKTGSREAERRCESGSI